MDKLDYKKAEKELYLPSTKPAAIEVPGMPFIMVDGKGMQLFYCRGLVFIGADMHALYAKPLFHRLKSGFCGIKLGFFLCQLAAGPFKDIGRDKIGLAYHRGPEKGALVRKIR